MHILRDWLDPGLPVRPGVIEIKHAERLEGRSDLEPGTYG
jgi:hypothetical protein